MSLASLLHLVHPVLLCVHTTADASRLPPWCLWYNLCIQFSSLVYVLQIMHLVHLHVHTSDASISSPRRLWCNLCIQFSSLMSALELMRLVLLFGVCAINRASNPLTDVHTGDASISSPFWRLWYNFCIQFSSLGSVLQLTHPVLPLVCGITYASNSPPDVHTTDVSNFFSLASVVQLVHPILLLGVGTTANTSSSPPWYLCYKFSLECPYN